MANVRLKPVPVANLRLESVTTEANVHVEFVEPTSVRLTS